MQTLVSGGSGPMLGPGLITGAADDDPSGIATYSQAGAQFGFEMLWTMFLTTPLMVGDPDGQRAHRPRHRARARRQHAARTFRGRCCSASSALLLVANTINIAADIAAMGEALARRRRPAALSTRWSSACSCLLLQVFLPYRPLCRAT